MIYCNFRWFVIVAFISVDLNTTEFEILTTVFGLKVEKKTIWWWTTINFKFQILFKEKILISVVLFTSDYVYYFTKITVDLTNFIF